MPVAISNNRNRRIVLLTSTFHDSMEQDLERLRTEATSALEQVSDDTQLEDFRIKYLGRNGQLSALMKQITLNVIDESPRPDNFLTVHHQKGISRYYRISISLKENSYGSPSRLLTLFPISVCTTTGYSPYLIFHTSNLYKIRETLTRELTSSITIGFP